MVRSQNSCALVFGQMPTARVLQADDMTLKMGEKFDYLSRQLLSHLLSFSSILEKATQLIQNFVK